MKRRIVKLPLTSAGKGFESAEGMGVASRARSFPRIEFDLVGKLDLVAFAISCRKNRPESRFWTNWEIASIGFWKGRDLGLADVPSVRSGGVRFTDLMEGNHIQGDMNAAGNLFGFGVAGVLSCLVLSDADRAPTPDQGTLTDLKFSMPLTRPCSDKSPELP